VSIVSLVPTRPGGPIDQCGERDEHSAGECSPSESRKPTLWRSFARSSAPQPAHHFFPLRPRIATATMTSTTRTPTVTTTNTVSMLSIVGRDVGERNGVTDSRRGNRLSACCGALCCRLLTFSFDSRSAFGGKSVGGVEASCIPKRNPASVLWDAVGRLWQTRRPPSPVIVLRIGTRFGRLFGQDEQHDLSAALGPVICLDIVQSIGIPNIDGFCAHVAAQDPNHGTGALGLSSRLRH
jgi:hypothetical protein